MEFNKHYEYLTKLETNEKNETDKTVNCCQIKENYQNDNGLIKCKLCNNIITNISTGPEWRFYGIKDSKNADPTRCGMPVNTLLPESSVGSSVSFNSNTKTMNQIRKYQQWHGMPYKERSLYKVFIKIQTICERYHIPIKIINEAKSLYAIIADTKISRGANREGIIAACLYFACKECNVPRSSKEIASMFDITVGTMTKGIKKCQEIIFMNKMNKNRLAQSTPIKPENFIERFCNKLNLTEKATKLILLICKHAVKDNIISENTPPSIAAGCIFYFIKKTDNSITKKKISEICKTSEVTINKCCKKIEEYCKIHEEKNRLFNEILYNTEYNSNN